MKFAELSIDSRTIKPGGVFFAIPGERYDGHDHAQEALDRGASLLVLEREVPLSANVPVRIVPDCRKAWAQAWAKRCGNPERDLAVHGVTGTNGKTSVLWMVRAMLALQGTRCLSIGTLGISYGGSGDVWEKTPHTSPDPAVLFPALAKAKQLGLHTVFAEVSSHSVVQERFAPIDFASAVWTSFSRDHLDFHGTEAAYWVAKQRFFSSAKWRLAESSLGLDCDLAYGQGSAGLRVKVGRVVDGLQELELEYQGQVYRGRIPYLGHYACHNFAAAWVWAQAAGEAALPPQLWPELPPVPGRLQRLYTPGEPLVFVDYAHTPAALAAVLKVLRSMCKRKLYVLFGCGGERDRGKRPLMGRAAELGADGVVVSTDNPRSEDPAAIITDIMQGVLDKGRVKIELDRREGINRLLELAKPEDVVLIAGKGHEREQELAGGARLPFDDCEVVRNYWQGRGRHVVLG